tara:strand:- start:2801 stop:3529 length:729 start_codon:yes stop_codon:yes gene_type:complete
MAFIVGAAIIGGVTSLVGTAISARAANKQRKSAEAAGARADAKIKTLEDSRKPIINPYSNVKDISSMAADLSSMISNPFGDLAVATQAAEIQMEQSDIALANTLDALRASGASAGGATALAQAALQSKKGVAASIESQEAQNEKLKAQGEQQMQQAKMAEAQRLQQVQLSEAGRLQEADIQGQKFVFGQQEARTQQGLDRAAGLATQAAVDKNQALSNQAATIAGGVSAVGNIGSAYIKAKG